MMYIPPDVLAELDRIKKVKGIKRNKDLFREARGYLRVGFELDNILNLGLPYKKKKGGGLL